MCFLKKEAVHLFVNNCSMTEFRLLITELLLRLAFRACPNKTIEKNQLAKFFELYFLDKINRTPKQ